MNITECLVAVALLAIVIAIVALKRAPLEGVATATEGLSASEYDVVISSPGATSCPSGTRALTGKSRKECQAARERYYRQNKDKARDTWGVQEVGNGPSGCFVEMGAGGTGRFQFNAGPGASACLLYTSPSPRDGLLSRMPSSA